MATSNYKKGVSLAEEAVNEILQDIEQRPEFKQALKQIPKEKLRRIKIKWCSMVQTKMDWIRIWC